MTTITNNKQCGICADCVPQIDGGSGFNNCAEAHAAQMAEEAEMNTITRFTKEQLRERAREKVKSLEFAVTQNAFADSRAELEEELELARIALASLTAEPVYQYQSGIYNEDSGETEWYWDDCDQGFYLQYAADRRRIVYAAQPAPTVTFYRDGIEAAAAWVDQQRESYDSEHGRHDPDTGTFEFGNDAQRDYSATLEEIAEGIRALQPNTAPPAPVFEMISWPMPHKNNQSQGWTVCPDFLHQIREKIGDDEENFDLCPSLEMVEAVLLSAAMLQGKDFRENGNSSTNNCREIAETSTNSPVIPDCWCHTCRSVKLSDMRFVVCPDCGNKRCPHANDHRNACTGSNDLGQEGSAYT